MDDSRKGSLRTYLIYLLTVVGAITMSAALGFYHFEAGRNPNVRSFWDSFWWAIVTMTTIGYGDIIPVSRPARMLAMVEAVFGMFYVTLLS